MKEIKGFHRGRHLISTNIDVHILAENKPSCGCDKDIHVDVSHNQLLDLMILTHLH